MTGHTVDPAPTLGPASGALRYPLDPGESDAISMVWRTRGRTTEAVLTWAGDPAALMSQVPPVAADVESLANQLMADPTAPVTLLLVADHPGESIDPLPEAVAETAGLTRRRDLFELRRPLPVPDDHALRRDAPSVTVRPFRPGTDDDAWIRVNNRAFVGHPDQGAETPATLAARCAEEWFDPTGFLVLDDPERPGELAGFCWTKVHRAAGGEGARGEIYVIGVDPSHRGERLGSALVLAGLDHLASLGLAEACLFVDETNRPARRLYDDLGFAVHIRRRIYTAASTPPIATSSTETTPGTGPE